MQTHFRQSFESSPESRGSQTSGVLFGYFLHDAKSDNPYSFAGSSEVLQTSNQHIQTTNSHNPIKSFAASRLFPPPLAAIPSALFIQLHRILPFQPPSTLAKLTKCTKNSISPLTEPFFCVILSPTKKEMHKFISSLDFNERMAYHMRFSFQSALCFDRMFRPGHEQCVGLSLCRSIG